VAGFCEHGNELSGPMKGVEFLKLLDGLFSFSRRILLHGVSYPCKMAADLRLLLGIIYL
jgi:hypothetical protein